MAPPLPIEIEPSSTNGQPHLVDAYNRHVAVVASSTVLGVNPFDSTHYLLPPVLSSNSLLPVDLSRHLPPAQSTWNPDSVHLTTTEFTTQSTWNPKTTKITVQ
ncbi:hypothetical protein ACFX1W_024233 [Malus domestica]